MTNRNTEKQFLEQIAENQGILHKITGLYARNDADRQDLFQEILAQLWRSYPSFSGQSKFSTWLYRVALNTAITSFRKTKTQASLLSYPKEIPQLPDRKVFGNEEEDQLQLLHMAISQLSQVEKALVMLYLEEKSYDEIAEIMGISKTNVGVKLNRTKQKLQKIMTTA